MNKNQKFSGRILALDENSSISYNEKEDVILKQDAWNDYGYRGLYRVQNSKEIFGFEFNLMHISDVQGTYPPINTNTGEITIDNNFFAYFEPDFYEQLKTITNEQYQLIYSFMKQVNTLTDLNSFKSVFLSSKKSTRYSPSGQRVNFFSHALFRDSKPVGNLDNDEYFTNFIRQNILFIDNWSRDIEPNLTDDQQELIKRIKENITSMDRTYTAFISSTYSDLEDERQIVLQSLLKSGNMPINMENFNSIFQKKLDVILPKIKNSDFFILILGARYGKRISGAESISFTEWEFNQAQSFNKPTLVISLTDNYLNDITSKKIGATEFETKDPNYISFKKRVHSNYVRMVNDSNDLKSAIETGVIELVKDIRSRDSLAGLVSLKEILSSI